MNWLGAQMALIDAATGVIEFAVNWLLQSCLLIGVGLAVGRLLRRRGSAVQSVVYRTTLAACLICPVATLGLSQTGVSGWSVELPREWGRQQVTDEVAEMIQQPSLPEADVSTKGYTPSDLGVETNVEIIQYFPEQDSSDDPAIVSTDVNQSVENPPLASSTSSAESTESLSTELSPTVVGYLGLGLGAGWVGISLVLVIRLAIAFRRLSVLRAGAVAAEEKAVQTCQDLSVSLGVAAPEVLRSPYLPSPCLAGLRNPAVLLPEVDQRLSIREVLIHELAHLRRHDCHWNLLRQIATSLFFFQPLLWKLSRRIESTAEEVCDDYVVHLGGDRHIYAHGLVDIAELSAAPMASAGVGIVSLRSMLAMRVTRIMDTSRSLSTRVGNLLLVVVLVSGLAAATTAGLIGLAPPQSQAEAEQEIVGEPSGSDDAADKHDSDVITIRGIVVDPDGSPVEGAQVRLVRWYWDPHIERKPLNVTHSDENGYFQVTYRKSQFDVNVLRPDQWKEVAVAAFKPGYGPDWVWWDEVPRGEQARLQLPVDDQPILGRVVDLEGQPLSGIKVSVGGLAAPKNDDLSDWTAAVKEEEPPWLTVKHLRDSGLPFEGTGIPETVVTDNEGRFRLSGIGRERKIDLLFEGSTVARTEVTAVTRNMAPIAQTMTMSRTFAEDKKWQVLGANFELTLPPTRVIEGAVRDAATGEPMEGVGVHSWMFAGTHVVGQRQIRSETDEHGRFRLVGMPKGPGNQIVAVPNDEQPYFMRVAEVPDPAGIEPVTVEFELHRGIWITGRVTNKATGEPVPWAKLFYLPFLTNEHVQALPEFHSSGNVDGTNGYQDRYQTAEDGTYRLVGMPGRAIVGVQAIYGDFRQGAGSEEIEGMNERGHFNTFSNPIHPGKKWPTAMKEISPDEEAETIEVDFELDPGGQIEFTMLDPQRQMLSGVRVTGQRSSGSAKQIDTATFTATAFGPEEVRTILFHHKDRNLGKVIRARADRQKQAIRVQLEPCARIKGRLVDSNEAPVKGAQIRVAPTPTEDFNKELARISTDSDGRFEHSEVLPGAKYAVMVESPTVGFHSIAKSLDVSPGETIDLGTVDVTSDERPEPVRAIAAEPKESNSSSSDNSTVTGQDGDSREYEGKVVDPSGHPVEDADLFLVFHIPEATGLLKPKWKPIATTDSEGAFNFAASPADFGIKSTGREFGYGSLVAVKEGFGFAWSPAGMYEKSGNWLRDARARLRETPAEFLDQMKQMLAGAGKPLQLVMDNEPIRGRIVDINGQPVLGAKLTLLEVRSGNEDDLTAWRNAASEDKADYYSARMKTPVSMNGPQVRSLVKQAVTNADGRFTLRGVGQGRIAELLLEGPGIESAKVFARTEAGETIELMRERRSPDLGSYIYYPSEFTFVAGPSVAITGVVRDAETKLPLSGVTVKSQKRHGEPIHGWGQDFVRAVTNEHGEYRLNGMPIGADNRIAAIAPMGEVAYFSMSKRAETTSHDDPLEINFELRSGVWIEGRITDRQTGEGLSGRLAYYVKKENPNYNFARALGVDQRDRLLSDDQGRFRIAVLAGPGFISFMAHEHQNYPRADSILKADGSLEKVGRTMLETGPSMLMPQNYHLVTEVNPNPQDERVELDLELDSGNSLIGRVVDPDDRPVTNYYYTGRMAQFDTWRSSKSDRFELTGYDPQSPRHVYIAQRDRNLAGHVVVSGEAPEDLVVKLQQAGKVTGRVVDEDGSPLPNCQLIRWSPPMSSPADSNHGYHAPPLPRNMANSTTGQYETDDEGRFTITCLAPGVEYRLRAFDRANLSPSRGRVPKFSGPLDVVIKLEPGETEDLGDVRLVDEKEFVEEFIERAKPAEAKTSEADKQASIITGRVILPNGKPAAGAYVAVIAMRIQPRRGGDYSPAGEVLAEGRTGNDGNFELRFKGVNSKTHSHANVIARQEGSAVAWRKINLDEQSTEVSLEVLQEEAIDVELVNIEGQPASGVQLQVQSIVKKMLGLIPSRNGVGYRGEKYPIAWLPAMTSDEEGKLSIRGVPKGHGVFINVIGNNRFAPQEISLNTGMPEQRGKRDGTYRALVRNVKPGEVATLPLAPAQLFEGTVTYEDTGQPAPHARLTIWASQEEYGSMASVAGRADSEGRYRISPKPGIRFGLRAYSPDGEPYLARRTPSGRDAIRWRDGDVSRRFDIALPRGVVVRGKVVEAGTNIPVSGASIQYKPETANNRSASDDVLTGWQAIQLSNEQGEFEIVVLPGLGRLLVHGPNGKYVLQEIAGRQLASGKPGGFRNYAHAIYKINPEKDSDPLDVTISLTPGATVSGKIVDESGASADEVMIVTRLNISPTSLRWRGPSLPTIGGRFELSGLEPGKEYAVHFLDAKRRLGATVNLRADMSPATAVLKPCGDARLRFVDLEGNPHVDYRPGIQMVVTPGAPHFDSSARNRGKLAADEDFIANINRSDYYWRGPRTDEDGRVSLLELVPGATYRMYVYENGENKVLKEFTVDSGETLDLGEFAVDRNG